MGLLDWLPDLLKDIPVSGVLRERNALAEAQYAALEAENARLTREVNRLANKNTPLRLKITPIGFVEARGVLFKRRADGGFDPDPHCPTCRQVLAAGQRFFSPKCSTCGFRAPFKMADITSVIESLA